MESSALSLLCNIYRSQPVTRRSLCEQTGLSVGRINMLVSDLLSYQLIHEEIYRDAALGRPPALLSLNPDAGLVAGLEIDGAFSRAVLCDINGQILASVEHSTKIVPNQAVILENITRSIEAVCQKGGTSLEKLSGLGLALSAIVDTEAGIVLDWPSVPAWAESWKGVDLRAELKERLGIELVMVDDRARTLGLTTARFGAARRIENFLYILLSDGIGCGVFVGGYAYRGSSGTAGELGHVTVDEEGPWCSCGNQGCLEVMASTTAVLRRVQERLAELPTASALREPYEKKSLTLAGLIEAARSGDKLAFQILDETGIYIGKVLAIALNMLSPELVILGGPLTRDGGIVLEAVQRQVRLRALQHILKRTSIVYDDQSEWAGSRGATLLVLDTLFASEAHLTKLLRMNGSSSTLLE